MRFPTSVVLACLLTVPAAFAGAETATTSDQGSDTSAANPALSNPLSNPDGIVDRLMFFRTAEDWKAGDSSRIAISEEGNAAIYLDDERARFPRRGRWTSPEVETTIPFSELIPSYNAETPGESGVNFHVRVRDAESGDWSPWLYIGQWGTTVHWPSRTIEFDHGKVNVDNLVLERLADGFQMRVDFYDYGLPAESAADGGAVPSLRLLAVNYSGVVEDEELRERYGRGRPIAEGDWARSLPVPFIPQRDSGPEIGGSTCSPTCVTMAMAYRGVEMPLVANCLAIYDREYAIFGNWARGVAQAGEHGLNAWLTRVRSWEDVKSYIAEGTPLIASIRFGEGEFPSNVMNSTNGHLILIRGMTEDGDLIVNDPASRDRGEGVVYVAEELANAWWGRGGIAYVIGADIPEWVPTYTDYAEGAETAPAGGR